MLGVCCITRSAGRLAVTDVGLGDDGAGGIDSVLVLERGLGSGGGGESVAIDDDE